MPEGAGTGLEFAVQRAMDRAISSLGKAASPRRSREAAALEEAREQWQGEVESFVAEQFLFDRQWKAVKAYANERNISIVGDMPIYVGAQSADVWCFPDLFELGDSGAPVVVSGVPPDAFSETGQLWGSPLYDWPVRHRRTSLT